MKYISVYGVGVNQIHSNETFYIDRPNGLDKWLLLIIKSHAFFVLDGKGVITRPNTAIIFKPNMPQFYHGLRKQDVDRHGQDISIHGQAQLPVEQDDISLPYGENYQDHWMEFDMEENLIEDMEIPLGQPITGFDVREIDDLFSLMMNECYFGGPKKDRYIELFMTAILEKISEATTSSGKKQGEFEKLQQQIKQHPEKNWNVEAAAKSLNFSSSHFQRIYRNLFGISFGNDVIKSRIRLASQLLATTDYSISQISSQCGYHSDNYFVRQFKKITNMTPSKYRKMKEPY